MAARRRKAPKAALRWVDLRNDPVIAALRDFALGPAQSDLEARYVLHDLLLERYPDYEVTLAVAADSKRPIFVFFDVNRLLAYEHQRLSHDVDTPWGKGRGRFATAPFVWITGELPFHVDPAYVLTAVIPDAPLTTDDVVEPPEAG